ncbi:Crp/Fnr family transcriptional regulator [Falsihalocynthiibacter sp. S25ZX9]|uniref:Crp/Fnr family transcriptional regulator n=1 Tax=Falsihalocynthiibacter sp. S25ZX9 TaxID=3240870 RepID=UPI003510C8FA
MSQFAHLNWIEVVGWLASFLTVASYSVGTMLPLRILAIFSSICFVLYSFTLHLWPLLAMELILLPINFYRFWQVLSLRGKVDFKSAKSQFDFSIIKTYGKRLRFAEGETVFRKGDGTDYLYFIETGRISIEELGVEMVAGDIFGEIAFFTDAATRTATASCIEQAKVYALTEKQLMRLQFEDPRFGMAVMRTITRRLQDPTRKLPINSKYSNQPVS